MLTQIYQYAEEHGRFVVVMRIDNEEFVKGFTELGQVGADFVKNSVRFRLGKRSRTSERTSDRYDLVD